MKRAFAWIILLLALRLVSESAAPPATPATPVRETVKGVIRRMKAELTPEQLKVLDLGQLEEFLTPAERRVLTTEHLTFRVNQPVTVSIIRDTDLKLEPFWLRDEGFRSTGVMVKDGRRQLDVWEKVFPAGPIGLGVNSLSGGEHHYFVLLRPLNFAVPLRVTDLRPIQLRVESFRAGVKPYVDRDEVLESIPRELEGRLILRTAARWTEAAKLLHLFRWTEYPSSLRPDHVILTWSDDPTTTQTIQWRTSDEVNRGFVAFEKKSDFYRFDSGDWQFARAKTKTIEDRWLVNDLLIHWHTVVLRDLEPGTTYVYAAGTGEVDGWSSLAEFTTAPAEPKPFTFIYLGDAQNGLDRWGTLLHNAFRAHPEAAFYVMAGDLVNWGSDRDDWDNLFHNAQGVYNHRPVLPALGNHDCLGGHPTLYLQQFHLLRNGPARVEPERAYAFEYGNALFLFLDSNLKPETQTAWLESRLATSNARWKFVVYHHPAYSSATARDNIHLRRRWTPIFDRYHVDMALQGHDHAYLRTFPIRGERRVSSPAEGTIYVVAVSGIKRYAQEKHDYTAVGFTSIPTYQVLDLTDHRLTYRAFDTNGQLRDELIIQK